MMRLISVTLMTLMFMATAGQAAAADAEESELANLFTSKQVRKAIDNKRQGASGRYAEQSKRTPGSVTVNGVVKRSDGKTTVWVNGKDMRDRTIDGVKVPRNQRSKDTVAVYVDGRLVRIKPGERWSDNRD